MKFTNLPLRGACLVDLEKREDGRGFFSRYFCRNEFLSNGLEANIEQINTSLTTSRSTLRGLHFQRPPHTESKVVRCISGAIWDVVLDIRKNSETYGQWFGTKLDACNRTMMYVPPGFAHGFITLTDTAEVLYLVSAAYAPDSEGTVRWNDPFHGIAWPEEPLQISEKDKSVSDWTDNNSIVLENS